LEEETPNWAPGAKAAAELSDTKRATARVKPADTILIISFLKIMRPHSEECVTWKAKRQRGVGDAVVVGGFDEISIFDGHASLMIQNHSAVATLGFIFGGETKSGRRKCQICTNKIIMVVL
jgi:hypothetical protein